ncbi:MAG: hypothetical protein ACREV9_10820 [Burkholderiales bacterium]
MPNFARTKDERVWPLALCAILLLGAKSATIEDLLDQAIAGEHRSEKNKAPDQYRHPKETLLFSACNRG